MTDMPTTPSDDQAELVQQVHERGSSDQPTPRIGEQAGESTSDALEHEREAVTEDFEPGATPVD
ncbi:hypothetical protein [Auraticoccus monumenti]|nr:hypothetical protein [Auraticoccus monumenti]